MQYLKEMKIWICWSLENRDGKLSKIPYDTKDRNVGTSEDYSSRWVTYDEAIAAVRKKGFDGVGFVIPAGYAVIDLDHVDLEGDLAIGISKLMDTYEEVSPSGEGEHLVFKVDISKIPVKDGKLHPDYYCKNQQINVELYIGGLTNRYMTFTGNVITDNDGNPITDLPVEDRTEEVLEFLEKYMKKSDFNPVHMKENHNLYENVVSVSSSGLSDNEVIKIARSAANSDKFISLFYDGDISTYESQSEAEMALCDILAYYSGGNEEQIARLMMKSALYREKWERDDYRNETIKKAVAFCDGNFYSGSLLLPDYIHVIESGKSVKVKVNRSLLANHILENLNYLNVRDKGRGSSNWFVYENGVYIQHSDDLFKGVICKYITDYDESILKMSDVNEVFNLLTLKSKSTNIEELNSDEDIVNFSNGILRLSDMTLHSHDPDLMSTIQIPCEWSRDDVPTPHFDRYMSELTSGDKAVEKLLLEYMGACLSNVKGFRFKKSLFLVGKGDTGKSQFIKLLEMMLGKGNYVAIDLSDLEVRFGTSNLYNRRLAGSSDMGFLSIKELRIFKQCTGGDSIFAEFKGRDGFEFIYGGMFCFCMNRFPKFGGDNGQWVYDRIIPVKCENVIPKDKQDKKLLEKLYSERAGIAHKAIMAFTRAIANGYNFTEPQSVIDARNKYMCENNTVISFFNDCMVPISGEAVVHGYDTRLTVTNVYKAYKAWCDDNNHGHAKNYREFCDDISNYLGRSWSDITVHQNKGTFFRDYTLSEEVRSDYLFKRGTANYQSKEPGDDVNPYGIRIRNRSRRN